MEAILILTTSKEIDGGTYAKFFKQSCFKNLNIPVVIVVNNNNHIADIVKITPKFKCVEIIYLNISPADDVYKMDGKPANPMPKLGNISGPNILFFESIKYCSKFKYVLLIETDCIIMKDDFIEKFNNFVQHSGDFWIAGATYDGKTFMDCTNTLFLHLNGVALYKTGCPNFQEYIYNVRKWIELKIHINPVLAYDVALTGFLFEKMGKQEFHNSNKHIYRKLIKTSLILNYSISSDKETDLNELTKLYPTVCIIHKKS